MTKFEKGMKLTPEQYGTMCRLYAEACVTYNIPLDHMPYHEAFERLYDAFCRETDLDISRHELYLLLIKQRMDYRSPRAVSHRFRSPRPI